jgi:hypothetical protein
MASDDGAAPPMLLEVSLCTSGMHLVMTYPEVVFTASGGSCTIGVAFRGSLLSRSCPLEALDPAEGLRRGVCQVKAAKTRPNRAIRVARVPKMMVSFWESWSKAKGVLLLSEADMIIVVLIVSDMTGL